jgi:hypothetical protein
VAAEKNSTIVFPVPIDLLDLIVNSPSVRRGGGDGQDGSGGRGRVHVPSSEPPAVAPPREPESHEGVVS